MASRLPHGDRDANRIGTTHIYIGSLGAAMNQEFLAEENIRYTLTLAKGLIDVTRVSTASSTTNPIRSSDVSCPSPTSSPKAGTTGSANGHSGDIERAVFPLKDDGKDTLFPHGKYGFDDSEDDGSDLTLAMDFIDEAQKKGSNVLVHCEQGVSRSVAMVCAYLIVRRGMTFEESLSLIRETRPQAKPNIGFGLQLSKLEAKIRNQRGGENDREGH